MAFDALVRFFFSDNGLSVGLARANEGLRRVASSGSDARRGLGLLQVGVRQLAFEAAGLSGGLGRVAESALRFGGGSALVLSVTAGLGALALAHRVFTADSRAAAEQERAFREELVKTAAARREARVPEISRIGTDVREAQERLDRLTAERTSRIAALRPDFFAGLVGQEFATFEEFLRNDAKLVELDRERATLSLTIAQNRQSERDALAGIRVHMEEIAVVMRGIPQAIADIPAGVGFRGTTAQLERALGLAPIITGPVPIADTARPGIGFGIRRPELPERSPFRVEFARAPRPIEAPEDPSRAAAAADLRRAMQAVAFSNLFFSAQQGGFQGLLQGAGGFLTTLEGVNPLFGAGLSIASSLLARPHRQVLDVRVEEFGVRAHEQLRRTRGEPERGVIQIVLDGQVIAEAVFEDVMYRQERARAQDAIPRGPRRA